MSSWSSCTVLTAGGMVRARYNLFTPFSTTSGDAGPGEAELEAISAAYRGLLAEFREEEERDAANYCSSVGRHPLFAHLEGQIKESENCPRLPLIRCDSGVNVKRGV